jgi:hypothetical protein
MAPPSVGAAISSVKNELARRMDQVADALPLPGGQSARFAGMAGTFEGALFNGGTVAGALGGGVISWLSAWGAESLGRWTDSTRPGEAAFRLATPVRQVQRLGTRWGARDGYLLLTSIVQGALGALMGLGRRTGNRLNNVCTGVFWEGLMGAISAYVAESGMHRLDLLTAEHTEFEPLLPSLMMQKGGVPAFCFRVREQRLPASRIVQKEHRAAYLALPRDMRANFRHCEAMARRDLRVLLQRLGLNKEVPLTHRVHLLPSDTKYWPLKPGTRVRHRIDSDEGGLSFVRYRVEAFEREHNEQRIFSMCRELVRADLSLHVIEGGDEVVLVDGVRRVSSRDPDDPARKARARQRQEFNRTTAQLIAHVATGIEQPGSMGMAKETRQLISYYRNVVPDDLKDDFLRSIILARMRGELGPLVAYFARVTAEQMTPDLAGRIEQDLLALRWGVLPKRAPASLA